MRAFGKSWMVLKTVLHPLEHSVFSVKLHRTGGSACSVSKYDLYNALDGKD